MISKGYHYVIYLRIACNIYIKVNPVYPRCSSRRSVVEGEQKAIWVVSSS